MSPEEGVPENLLSEFGDSEKFLSSWLGLRSARRCLAGNWTSSILRRELGVSSVVPRDESKLDPDIRASGIRSLQRGLQLINYLTFLASQLHSTTFVMFVVCLNHLVSVEHLLRLPSCDGLLGLVTVSPLSAPVWMSVKPVV